MHFLKSFEDIQVELTSGISGVSFHKEASLSHKSTELV
jgi:hypothetical protein